MPPRIAPITDEVDAINQLAASVSKLQNQMTSQALPGAFVFTTTASGELAIRRVADGATQVIAF